MTRSSISGSRRSRLAIVQAALFLAAIATPLAVNLAGVDGGDPQTENRELATMNEGVFAWFGDHFGLRSTLVKANAGLEYFGFHLSPSPSVIRGRDGWLYYGDSDAVEDFVSRHPLNAQEVAAWRDTVVRSRDWLQARGAAYVFTIAPDKHVIYPEHMPLSMHPVHTTRRMDQVLEAVASSGVAVDVRPAVEAAKARERVYHLTDSHWNARGALVAYQQIVNAVRAQNPAVPPAWKRSDFEEGERRVSGLDLARMMGLHRALHELDLMLIPKRPRLARVVDPPGAEITSESGRIVTAIPGSHLPRAVVFRDSFTTALAPFLAEHFSRAVFLWQKDFVPEQVVEEGADVVIYEIAGRHLYDFVASPSLIAE
jgi:alginate O-acetyltransferase complex protein AlgJ